MSHKTIRVIVGMSGGVDSSVAALMLKQQGYAVEGLFMKNWEEDDTDSFCSAAKDIADAESVCNRLQIPLHTVNFSSEYWERVFEHFINEHQAGRTPNPDIVCNREIKFNVFLKYAISLGADYIATGHYAIKEENSSNPSNNRYFLKKSVDMNKDQSYFLYTLNQTALSKTLFPIGFMNKQTVRSIAETAGFANYQKKDSTGLCFVGERHFKTFLNRFLPKKPGNIETTEGNILGLHEGLMFYTLGQRQGIGIGGQANSNNEPWYVVAKDLDRNVLVVAKGNEHPLLYRSTLLANNLHWITTEPKFPLHCTAKIRYRQTDSPCLVTLNNSNDNKACEVIFNTPQRAITPGQSIVFYDHDICLGGGIIQ